MDVRTLLFANAVVFAVLAATMILVWRSNRRFPGLAPLARVHVAMMAGTAIIRLEPGVVPAHLSMIAGNGLVVLSVAWLLEGVRGLFALPRDHTTRVAILLWISCLLFFLYLHPSLRARLLITSLVAFVLLLRSAWTARIGLRTPAERGPSLLLIGSLGLIALLFIARSVSYAAITRQVVPLEPDALTVALVTASLLAGTGWTFGVMVLVYARLNREAVEALRSEADLRLQALITRSMNEGVCLVRASDGTIAYANPKFERIFGYEPGELKDKPVQILNAGSSEEADAAHQNIARELMENGAATYEINNLRKDGTPIWCRATTVLFDHPEHGPVFVAVQEDVTQRKRMERIKDDFVSVVSHELRTPLTSIRGSLGLLAGGAVGEMPAAARSLLDIANSNCERLVRLINDILDMEKIGSGKMAFAPVPLDLVPLVEQAILSNRAYAHGFGVEIRLAEACPGRVLADPDRLHQVLTNLLSNAARHSPRGAAVEVRVRRLDGKLRVSVTDHGAGIPPEFQPRVFEKFAQADSSSSRREGGTGLGLSISRAIVERLGGKIWFETQAGVGTTFFFDLADLDASPGRPSLEDELALPLPRSAER
ncbi:MAG TPA: ATP-binding protein [Thermoanaerobaculia bacterium]